MCSRTHYTLRTTYARVPQCSSVYASAPAARCIPLASVMGIEPIGRWVWRPDRPPGRTPYDSFLAGESDPVVGGRTPFAGLAPAVLGVHAPSRQLTRALPPASPAARAASATPAGIADELGEDIPNLSASVTARATSATLALYAFGDDSHHLPAPSRGKKERKLF